MRYHVLHIETTIDQEWLKDLFDQHICELGVDTIDGDDYYIQSELWEQNHEDIEAFCGYYEGVRLVSAEQCPDANWNAVWEAEHPVQELPLGVRIVPHCAFGAGHHETTSMLINTLLSTDLTGENVLDHGTGTGVLAIFAKKLGAAYVQAIDIDEKSVENAQENAALNHVEIDARLGDSVPSPLEGEPERRFHLILANIHRNILMENMPSYAASLVSGGELWLSGFYEDDCPALIESARSHGLCHIATLHNGEWCMLQFLNDRC